MSSLFFASPFSSLYLLDFRCVAGIIFFFKLRSQKIVDRKFLGPYYLLSNIRAAIFSSFSVPYVLVSANVFSANEFNRCQTGFYSPPRNTALLLLMAQLGTQVSHKLHVFRRAHSGSHLHRLRSLTLLRNAIDCSIRCLLPRLHDLFQLFESSDSNEPSPKRYTSQPNHQTFMCVSLSSYSKTKNNWNPWISHFPALFRE